MHREASILFPRETFFKREISIKLTATNVRDLALADNQTDRIWLDDDLSGFGYRLRRTSRGINKTWIVQYRLGSRQRRVSFDASRFTADAARKVAKDYLARVQLGQDPAAERDKAREAASAVVLTLGDVAARYLDAKKDVVRLSSFNSINRTFQKHFEPLMPRPLTDIGRGEIAAQLQTIIKKSGRTAAALSRKTLSSLFTWAMREGLCEANPVISTNDPLAGIDTSRDRVLSDAELVKVWNACAEDDFGRIVRLLILTGCRRDEIGSLRWSEIDLDAGTLTIPAERSKNGKAHCLTLPPMVLDILRAIPRRDGRDYVFGQRGGGFSRWSWHTDALRELLGEMPAFTLHDLRRTFRTGLGRLGIPSHIAELAINHTRGGIEAVYDRHSYQREIAAALAAWANHDSVNLDGRPAGNVTPLRRA
jgi:integrase